MSKTPIKHIYIFANGMCAVFDTNGQQIPELQGKYEDLKGMIKKRVDKQEELPLIERQEWRELSL